jgi:hypothetical protein
MKDKTDSLQFKSSTETIIVKLAIDLTIGHEHLFSKQQACKESNELFCSDEEDACKLKKIKEEHSKADKEKNDSDILNEILAKEGISSNKKSIRLFDRLFSLITKNESFSLKKENNKLKERNEALARENNNILLLEKNNKLENEILDRKNDELNIKYKILHDYFINLNEDYRRLLLSKKNGDKEIESLNYKIRNIEEENLKLKLEYDGWNENKMQLIRELASLKVGSQSRLQHDQLFERFKQFKEQDIHDLIFKISSAFNVNGQTRRKLMASIKKDIAEIIFIKNSPRLHEDKILKPMIDDFFDKLKITDSVSAELYLLCEKTLIKGFTLVEDASQAVPPANFYFVEANALFNEHKHEANLGCVTEGNIEFTIFPAYIVSESEEKQRVFEKALVWTNEEIRL